MCKEERRNLRRAAKKCQGARLRTKLFGKTTWFKMKGASQQQDQLWSRDEKKRGREAKKPQRTVLFEEQTPNRELLR